MKEAAVEMLLQTQMIFPIPVAGDGMHSWIILKSEIRYGNWNQKANACTYAHPLLLLMQSISHWLHSVVHFDQQILI